MRFPPVKNYYSMGAPYVKSIDFSTVTSFTGNVVVGSSTYVFDTDFGWTPRSPVVLKDAAGVANSFADCVNGFYGDTTPAVTQNASAFARCFGTKCYLIGRLPNDNFTLTSTMTGETIATHSTGTMVTVPVTGTVTTAGLTDAELRATPVPVSGTVTATGPLTDTELRATAVPVSGPLTDTELRATAVPVSGTVTATGPLTDTELRATAVPVSGPLTDTELRATAVPVSGTVTVTATTGSTWTSASGTITSGGASQELVAASASRKGLLFQNTSDIDMWLGLGVTAVATQPCIKIAASEKLALTDADAPVTAVNLYGVTTGKTFTCYTR
jgi:hypothetical protein